MTRLNVGSSSSKNSPAPKITAAGLGRQHLQQQLGGQQLGLQQSFGLLQQQPKRLHFDMQGNEIPPLSYGTE